MKILIPLVLMFIASFLFADPNLVVKVNEKADKYISVAYSENETVATVNIRNDFNHIK